MANYKKFLLIACCALVIQTISTLANASVAGSIMKSLDRDRDGLISLREATKSIKILENFSKIDLNEDGFISELELSASGLVEE